MENVTLYNLLSGKLLQTWRDEAKQNDDCGFTEKANELMQELTAELNDKDKRLLDLYSLAVEDRLDYLYHLVNIKILNFGVKIGMELQTAFAKFEE